MIQLQPITEATVNYPDCDGKPMSDNTKQFRWIVVIQQNLEWLFADDATVFVAGDLLWYPIEGDNRTCNAPDVMVILGRPKGDRGSYQQWREANVAPQVVFEILSPSNTKAEMNRKLLFYNQHGVEEYYLYDPDKNTLEGWHRDEGYLNVIDPIANWVSPRLGIRLVPSEPELQIYRPNGTKFFSYVEISYHLEQTSQRLEQTSQRLEQTSQRLEQATQRAEQAEERAARLTEQLRALGIDPDA